VDGLCTYTRNATSRSDAGGGIDVLTSATLSSVPDAGARTTPSQDHFALTDKDANKDWVLMMR
jgi:hypothetical protein